MHRGRVLLQSGGHSSNRIRSRRQWQGQQQVTTSCDTHIRLLLCQPVSNIRSNSQVHVVLKPCFHMPGLFALVASLEVGSAVPEHQW
jgi:hypothetical protein